MEWYVFALLAPAFWALNSIFIKYLMVNIYKRFFPAIATVTILDFLFAFVVLILGKVVFSFPFSLYALLAGLFPLSAFWFYTRAVLIEEVSRVVTLLQLIPVFVALLSVVFLGEIIGFARYLGVGLIVLAAVLISYRRSVGGAFSGAAKFMIPFTFLIACYTVVDKVLLGFLDFWSLFFWNIFGILCGVLVLMISWSKRSDFVFTVKGLGKKGIFTAFVGEGMYVAGTICSLIALSLVAAPLASSLFGLQPFYVFFYTLFLSLFLPNVIKEEITKTKLALKVIAITIMLVGTWLII